MNTMNFTASLGAMALLAGGLSAQYSSTPVAYNFTDISGTGSAVGLGGIDDGGTSVPIGFNFNFYGAPINSINATTNGYLTTGADLTDFSPDCPSPSNIDPNGMIAPYFDDLSLTDHGEIYYQTLGTAPNRLAIIQWEDIGTLSSSVASMTFQVQMFETNSAIQFHYETLMDTSGGYPVLGENAFIGLEDPTGTASTEITCNTGAGVLTPGVSAYEFSAGLPFISAPSEAISGTIFNVPGQADPFTFYIFAWSLSNGPLGPIPLLNGVTLDLGLNFKIAGAGLTPATGSIASDNIFTPAGFDGTVVYWQAITIASFGPISGTKKSNSDSITVRDGSVFSGTIVAGTADTYQVNLTAGQLITLYHCRTDNTGGSGSTLDCYLCLVDPGGVTEIANDDGAGDCYVDGPFGASQIIDHTVAQTGTYQVVASAFQGIAGGEAGDYELRIIGAGAPSASLLTDDGPLCPGNPFGNLAGKLLQQNEFKQRR